MCSPRGPLDLQSRFHVLGMICIPLFYLYLLGLTKQNPHFNKDEKYQSIYGNFYTIFINHKWIEKQKNITD